MENGRPIPVQQTLADVSPEYAAFLDKFKPRKTTDDCYTPPNVYEAVCGWVERRYGVRRESFVRPFWPGGDYERFDYPQGCVVVDNPPFSIIAGIVEWYGRHGVPFFLFAPYLTNIGIGRGTGCCHVIAPWAVRYENGAEVPTSFVTSLDPDTVAESAPDLRAVVRAADAVNRRAESAELPKYTMPAAVLTSAGLGYMASHGEAFRVRRGDCAFIRDLDAMRALGKGIFGGALLLSERAAAERAAAERAAAERAAGHVFELSDRERRIQSMLGPPDRQTVRP